MYGSGASANRLSDYAGAKRYWESVKPWRGYTDERDRRPLTSTRSNHTKTIRKLADGSFACEYHNTDVVIFQPDGCVRITPYASKTTDEFFTAVLGYSPFYCYMNFKDRYSVLRLYGDKAGIMAREVTVRVDDEGRVVPVDETQWEMFKIYTMDRPKARRVLHEANYPAYRRWVIALEATGVKAAEIQEPALHPSRLTECLQDNKLWPTLLHLSLDAVREQLYRNAGVVKLTRERFIPWDKLESWYVAEQRYQHWV